MLALFCWMVYCHIKILNHTHARPLVHPTALMEGDLERLMLERGHI